MDKIKKFIIFCFVGGIATLIDYLVMNLSIFILGNSYIITTISKIFGIIVSMMWNFPANRYLTFKAKDGKVRRQLPKWLLVYAITSLINFLIFSIIIFFIGTEFLPRTIAFIIGTAAGLILNFIISLFWTFKK
jgi:putative flippase GtrA